MTLMIVEQVEHDEPRWWQPDRAAAEASLAFALQSDVGAVPHKSEVQRRPAGWPFAIVDRPAPVPTPAPQGAVDLGDFAELIEAVSYQLDPYQWTAEHMDEQHWIAVQAVMPRADELLDRCTAAEAGHLSAADALTEARAELAHCHAEIDARGERVKALEAALDEARIHVPQRDPLYARLVAIRAGGDA